MLYDDQTYPRQDQDQRDKAAEITPVINEQEIEGNIKDREFTAQELDSDLKTQEDISPVIDETLIGVTADELEDRADIIPSQNIADIEPTEQNIEVKENLQEIATIDNSQEEEKGKVNQLDIQGMDTGMQDKISKQINDAGTSTILETTNLVQQAKIVETNKFNSLLRQGGIEPTAGVVIAKDADIGSYHPSSSKVADDFVAKEGPDMQAVLDSHKPHSDN